VGRGLGAGVAWSLGVPDGAGSLGSALAQAAYAVAVRAAAELLTSGTYDSVAGGIDYDTMNDAVTAAP
jgi:hypothetical protein